MRVLIVLFGIFIGASVATHNTHNTVETGIFSYNDHDWFKQSPICTQGSRQSPININFEESKPALTLLNPIRISGFNSVPESIEITNKLHSIVISPEFTPFDHPTITGGPLNLDVYKFAQFHLHFGTNSTSGTEHHIDGVGGPMEIHVVFFNSKYGSFDNAADKSDGLCAVGFLFELSHFAPSMKIVKYLEHISVAESSYSVPDKFTLASILGTSPWPYFNYHGSLTTPPCTESVLWIVSRRRLAISPVDLAKFQCICGIFGKMTGNHRGVQPVNGRSIYRYNRMEFL